MSQQEPFTSFSDTDIKCTEPVVKIGLVATLNPQGLPHVTLLTTLMACSPTQLAFGQFAEGLSKKHLQDNPKAGFLIMSLDRHIWRGKADYTHTAREGKEYNYYNDVPMFRYNAYFGVHTVYYLDLVSHTGRQALPTASIVLAGLKTMLARRFARKPGCQTVLNRWTRSFLNRLGHLKFLAYVDADGYPRIIPAIQAQCLDAQRVLFSTSVYREELEAIPIGTSAAVFGMAMSMENVLVRGTYQGVRRIGLVRAGVLAIDWVYNSMPPTPGQVYPPLALEAVTGF